MMMRSIVRLRPALEAIKSDFSKNSEKAYNTDERLRKAIPSFTDFETIEAIIPPLTHIEALSETFSSDQNLTLPYVVPKLYNLHLHLQSMVAKVTNSGTTKDFAESLLENIEQRIPKCGSQNFFYAVGNLFHPFYKGFILHQMNSYHSTLTKFIEDNEEAVQQNLPAADLDEDSVDEDNEFVTAEVLTQRAMRNAAAKHCQPSSQAFSAAPFESAITPLKLELNQYMNLNEKDSKVDILGWWKFHSKEFPLLSQAAKKYLCIQVWFYLDQITHTIYNSFG